MSSMFRALLVGDRSRSGHLLARLFEGSNIEPDEPVGHGDVLASIARRAPDLLVIDCEDSTQSLAQTCATLKANPMTVLLPLMAIGKSSKLRMAAFDTGVDDFLTYQVRREEFLVRAQVLLRVSGARRQLAAEQLAQEVRHREQIRAAFRRYISPKVADQILANPDLCDAMLSSANRRVRAAVMFADMRGFTGISERLNPAQMVELLNEFFSLLTDITFEYDGTVFNMAGDCLMVGFGVPIEQSDGPQRAILAARKMLQQFAFLADKWKMRYDIETGLGIGINVGDVIAGNVGSAAYMNYTIIGDTVNVASRLGQRARAGELLFSDAVKRSLDATGVYIEAMPLPPLQLRGRTTPIDIYCVPTGLRVELGPH